jgi:hypothetical protein
MCIVSSLFSYLSKYQWVYVFLLEFSNYLQVISLKSNHKAESRGRGYYKLNSKILENEEYKEIINQLISKYQKKLVIRNTDPRTLWDVLKAEVRDITVKICKQLSREKKYELNKLEKSSTNFTIRTR